MGVFNGDMGILREINTFSETARVEFEDRRFVEYTFKQLESWNWLMRSRSTKHREASIRRW